MLLLLQATAQAWRADWVHVGIASQRQLAASAAARLWHIVHIIRQPSKPLVCTLWRCQLRSGRRSLQSRAGRDADVAR
jgi:hypothetical protein